MIKLNRALIKDKIYAAWLGKNIGGTIGAPYEGKAEMQDIHGFNSPKGEPIPNDDLDLQLVWLMAMESEGPWNFNANKLAEYWVSMITPCWNEYGIGKMNLLRGFQAPLSGEIENEIWRHSNGAWIRSEIWASLAPGFSHIARRYAIEDAMIDHGVGEGTYAELFTATLESEAFFESDLRKLIATALAQIPEDSFLARAVKHALECYDKGIDYRVARNEIVKLTEELGMFQAPANVAFAVIGLLYGEGDFKKTVIYAVNCGDDTDCTGGTAGAVLGIMKGTAAIPQDWLEYIGTRIITCSLNGEYRYRTPKDCEELTERVLALIPSVFKGNGVDMEFTDGESYLGSTTDEKYGMHFWDDVRLAGRVDCPALVNRYSRWSFRFDGTSSLHGRIHYDREPLLAPGETIEVTVDLDEAFPRAPISVRATLLLPDGFTADTTAASLFMHYTDRTGKGAKKAVFRITATERIGTENIPVLLLKGDTRAQIVTVPLVIAAK